MSDFLKPLVGSLRRRSFEPWINLSDRRRSGLQKSQTLRAANENWGWTAGSELENRIKYAPRFTKTVRRQGRVAPLPHGLLMEEEVEEEEKLSSHGWRRSPTWHRQINFKTSFNVRCRHTCFDARTPALNYFMGAAPWGSQCHALMPRPSWTLQRGQRSLSQRAVKHPAVEKNQGQPECHCSSCRH